mgnify:CR=1 FL=1
MNTTSRIALPAHLSHHGVISATDLGWVAHPEIYDPALSTMDDLRHDSALRLWPHCCGVEGVIEEMEMEADA